MINNHFNLTFLSNKYSKCYYNIVSKALQADREKLPKNNKNFVYYESHHIIPKSIKPEFKDLSVNAWNKVLLTPKEHFICHLLLTKMLTGIDCQKMCYAFRAMCNNQSNRHQTRFVSNLYEMHKKAMVTKLSDSRKGKTFDEIYGKEKANELKLKFKDRKPRGKMTEEEKQIKSESMKERSKTTPWKRFLQTNSFEMKKCEVCSLEVGPSNYLQHHGTNCKRILKTCPACNTAFFAIPWENKKYCCQACYDSIRRAQRISASADLT